MNFVQITMPENVWFITELIANCCDKAVSLTVLGANWCEFVHGFLLNLWRNVLLDLTLTHDNVSID